MFKTEKDNNLDSRYNLKEPVTSRYMNLNKKKYYLASADHNLEQLKEDQIKNLTAILIELKSEYDELIRESTMKKKETEQLGKQIEMLDKMDKKVKNKITEIEENYNNIESLIEIKKVRKEEEAYNRNTLISMIDKMKEEMLILQKEVYSYEIKVKGLSKRHEKEKFIQNSIKEKVNQVYSKIQNKRMKNSHERNEGNLVLQYYHNIIDQKWSFIHAADERKAKQIKISQAAKNDSQDKEEVEKRKLLFLFMLYDKYLKTKMGNELKENEELEETFQTIRDITGSSNLKSIVDKILNKDKNYNLCVSKVAEKQAKIAILKKDIASLEEKVVELQNQVPDIENDNYSKVTASGSEEAPSGMMDEEELKLVKEEESLLEEVKLMQDKHKKTKLIYEQVIDNIKSLCKISKDETINVTHSQMINLNEPSAVDSSQMMNKDTSFHLADEEILRSYVEFLENTKKNIDTLILSNSKEEFVKSIKEKGIAPVSISPRSVSKNRTLARKVTNAYSILSLDRVSKDLEKRPNIPGNEEYEYSDEELMKEDKEINEENEEIIRKFKTIERNRLMEAIKVDKDKK